MNDDILPEIAGRLDCSLDDFERSCRTCILEEQQSISPNNALIAVLCNAVRLKREYVQEIMKKSATSEN